MQLTIGTTTDSGETEINGRKFIFNCFAFMYIIGLYKYMGEF